jgi:opacity protein-like surface antigen
MSKMSRAARILGAIAILVLSTAAWAQDEGNYNSQPWQVSLLGGVQGVNKNNTAFPKTFVDIPIAGELSYNFNKTWGVAGNLTWLIPVKQTVDINRVSRKEENPNVLSYQANVLANLPLSSTALTPYATAGLGAITFLSDNSANRVPRLAKSQTAFGINFGVGTNYAIRQNWGLKLDYREFAAFPSSNTTGFSNGRSTKSVWMERAAIGVSYLW